MAILANRISGNLTPQSSIVPYTVPDKHGNEVTDICKIQNAYLDKLRYRLRQREIPQDLKDYENIQNFKVLRIMKTYKICYVTDFTMQEPSKAISVLKNGKCTDPHGFTREIFERGGNDLTLPILKMVNTIKNTKDCPTVWSNMAIQTIMKKTGSKRKLGNYRGVFLVPVVSLIFEKLLKKRISPHLEQNMTKFQTSGVKGKGVADNLMILRGMIDHAKYLG